MTGHLKSQTKFSVIKQSHVQRKSTPNYANIAVVSGRAIYYSKKTFWSYCECFYEKISIMLRGCKEKALGEEC